MIQGCLIIAIVKYYIEEETQQLIKPLRLLKKLF
jgi:hypothetical protein